MYFYNTNNNIKSLEEKLYEIWNSVEEKIREELNFKRKEKIIFRIIKGKTLPYIPYISKEGKNYVINIPEGIIFYAENLKYILVQEGVKAYLLSKSKKFSLFDYLNKNKEEKEVFEKFSIVLSIVVYLGFENLQSRNRKMIKKIIKKYLKGEKLNIEEKEYIEMMYKKLEDLREIIK